MQILLLFSNSPERVIQKNQWTSIVISMIANPKFMKGSSHCVHEKSNILECYSFMSYPDATRAAVMLICILKDSKIIQMETGAKPLN